MRIVTNTFLPKNTLDWLYLNVARPLRALEGLNQKTFWRRPIEVCTELEQDPDGVSSMILDQEEDKGETVSNGLVIKHYHTFLVRVYILLYYRHQGDPRYEEEVFPLLRQNMGYYGDPQRVGEQIDSKIEHRIDVDQRNNRYVTYSEVSLLDVGTDGAAQHDPVQEQRVLPNRVAYELFLKLLEGYEDDSFRVLQSSKSRIAELWQMMTGKSGESFRQYCSQRNYLNSHTPKDVERLNKKLAEIGIPLQLPDVNGIK